MALLPALQPSSPARRSIVHREIQRRASLAGRLHLARRLLGHILYQTILSTVDQPARTRSSTSRIRPELLRRTTPVQRWNRQGDPIGHDTTRPVVPTLKRSDRNGTHGLDRHW